MNKNIYLEGAKIGPYDEKLYAKIASKLIWKASTYLKMFFMSLELLSKHLMVSLVYPALLCLVLLFLGTLFIDLLFIVNIIDELRSLSIAETSIIRQKLLEVFLGYVLVIFTLKIGRVELHKMAARFGFVEKIESARFPSFQKLVHQDMCRHYGVAPVGKIIISSK